MDSELLMAYLDGDLSPLERGRIAEHIVKCEACRTTINDLRDVSDVLGRWEAPEPVALPEASDLLARAGQVAEAPPREKRFGGLSPRWAAAAALAVAASVIGLVSLPMFLGERAIEAPQITSVPAPPAESAGTQSQGAVPATGPDEVARLEDSSSEPQQPEREVAPPAERPAAPSTDAPSDVTTAGEEKAGPPGGFVGTIGEAPKREAPAEPEAVVTQVAPPPPPAPLAAAEQDMARDDAGAGANTAKMRKRSAAPRRAQSGSTLIRRANLELSGADAQALADRVGAVAGGADGRILSRSKQGRSDTIRMTLEVPVERFEEVYGQLKSLGTVRGETRWNNDISDRLEQIERELSDDDERAEASGRRQQPTRSQLERERVDLLERARKGTVIVTVRGQK